MAWPSSVITRQLSFGKAVVLETGDDLSLRVVTKASRSLVSQANGFRMEKLSASFETTEVGGVILFTLPVTNQAGWLDAESRLPIAVGPDKHSHLYETTLTIYRGTSTVASYNIGPYPVPQGPGVLDGDTMLVPDGTQQGALVPIPEAWANIIADASAIAGLKGQPGGIAELDADGDVINADGAKVGQVDPAIIETALASRAKSAPNAPGTFWGVWMPGNAPTPTGAGPHWGIEVSS